METLRRTCATMPQPSELGFGVVRAVGRGIALLDGGQRSPTGRGFRGFCFPTAYLCDHLPHLFDFKCQTKGQMLAVTKLNIYFKNKNAFLKQS